MTCYYYHRLYLWAVLNDNRLVNILTTIEYMVIGAIRTIPCTEKPIV